MSDTPQAPASVPSLDAPPPPSAPPRAALRRRRDDRVLGGVCSGLARYLGVDPVLVRVIVVVLAVFGGGVVLYALGWLLIPEEGREQSIAQQVIHTGGSKASTVVLVTLVVVVALALAASGGEWFGIGPGFGGPGLLLLIGAVALVVWLLRRDEQPPNPVTPSTPYGEPAMTMTTGRDPALPTTSLYDTTVIESPPVLATAPSPPKARSVLGLLTASVAALAAGLLITIGLTDSSSTIDSTTVLGAALAVVAVGLLVGTFVGRSRGLIALGIILAMATATSSALQSVDLSGGAGERTWTPITVTDAATDYRLGIGEATLDLRDLTIPVGGLAEPISASVGLGELTVYVPDDVDLRIMTDVGVGQVTVDGVGATTAGDQQMLVVNVPDDRGSIDLDLEVGAGEIAIRSSTGRTVERLQQGVLQ